MPDNETTGFDPQAIANVFGNEPEAVEVSQEPATDEKPAESPKSTPSVEKETPVSARIAAAKRAEAKAAQARGAVSAREQEIQQRARALEAAEKRNAERDAELRLMEEDPARYFEVKKLGAKGIQQHLERLAHGMKPEEVSEKRQTALETEMERLKGEIAKRDEEAAAKAQAAERAAAMDAGSKSFVEHIAGNVEAYPHLVQEFSSEKEAVAAGLELLDRVVAVAPDGRKITELTAFVAKTGKHPTNEQICKFLDAIAKERIEARANNAWTKRGTDTGGQPSGSVTRNPTVTGKPRTLSARDTSSRATAPNAQWSQEWADEESIRILRGT